MFKLTKTDKDQKVTKKRFIDLITGKLSQKEQEEAIEEIMNNVELQDQYSELKNSCLLNNHKKTISFLKLKKNFMEVEQKIQLRETRKNKKQFITVFRYAALLILVFSAYFLWKQKNGQPPVETYQTYTTQNEQSKISLEDGTSVWLNRKSQLRVHAAFNQFNRKVIIRGEAFFVVAQNEKLPFLVNAGPVEAKVLGTKFNIESTPGNHLRITLQEGRLSIYADKRKNLALLSPGEQINISEQAKIHSKKKVDATLYSAWKEDRYEYRHATLKMISKHLEAIYNISITFENKNLSNKYLRFTVNKTRTLQQTLDLLKHTAKLKYRRKGTSVLLLKG